MPAILGYAYRGFGSGPQGAAMVLLEDEHGTVLGPLIGRFTWGMPGFGTMTLADNLLHDAIGLHQETEVVKAFADTVVAAWDEAGFRIERWQIAVWLQTYLHNRSRGCGSA